jgi:hypothetical protein
MPLVIALTPRSRVLRVRGAFAGEGIKLTYCITHSNGNRKGTGAGGGETRERRRAFRRSRER